MAQALAPLNPVLLNKQTCAWGITVSVTGGETLEEGGVLPEPFDSVKLSNW